MQYTLVDHYIGVLSTREHVQRIFTSRPRWNPHMLSHVVHLTNQWGEVESVADQDLWILDRYPQIHGI